MLTWMNIPCIICLTESHVNYLDLRSYHYLFVVYEAQKCKYK